MHTVTLTTIANGNQIVKINRTSVEFTPAFTAKLAKMRVKSWLSNDDMPTIGKYTIIAMGNGRFSMKYEKNSISVHAATITIIGNKIVSIEGK